MNALFHGTCTATITPFNKTGIDFKTFEKQIERQLSHKIKTVAVCTTTGEAPTLTDDEYKKIVEFAVKVINKRATLIVGSGSNNTERAVEKSKFSEKAGADGVLAVTPYYNKCTQNGLIKYYEQIANAVSLPVIAYNVPARTGVNLLPETMQKIAKIPNVAGIKEASGSIKQLKKTVELTKGNAQVYCGDDALYLKALSAGAVGCFSATSNLFPKDFDEIYLNYVSGRTDRATRTQRKLKNVISALYSEPNPIPLKYAMKLLKLDKGILRAPLTELEKYNKAKLIKVIVDYGAEI